jgi:hypothetical protein
MIRNASKAQAETPIPMPVFAAVERRELPTLLEEEVGAIIGQQDLSFEVETVGTGCLRG